MFVDEAIDDLIVVSFNFGGKLFQGALLDATKKNLPLGLSPTLLLSGDKKGSENDSDRLYSVSQRHTYTQGTENESPNGQAPPRRPFKSFKDRNVRTMRLRPRQVLCSKCRSICNENSENVEMQNTIKDSTNSLLRIEKNEAVRLKPCSEALNVQQTTSNTLCGARPLSERPASPKSSSPPKILLRKRRSIDAAVSSEDEAEKKAKLDVESTQESTTLITKTSPVIKISFGPQGQGTVLKIPPRSHTYNKGDEEKKEPTAVEECPDDEPTLQMTRSCSAKAAKKALKKAKKEAHRKASITSSPTPIGLHHHKSRHHKHKFKHKRKHRDDDDDDDDDEDDVLDENKKIQEDAFANLGLPMDMSDHSHDPPDQDGGLIDTWNSSASEDSNRSDTYSEIKKECLRQKLSISLKRLNAKAYMRCNPSYNEDSNSSGTSTLTNSDTNSNSDHGEVPQFPESDLSLHKVEKVKPLMMRISSHNVRSCTIANGRSMAVGDIVWGKIHGFPWWPGKVLSIMVSKRDNGLLITQQAHVAWFGSSTSSYMPCSQLAPFLEFFKSRYNKKKRGPYKEAIKQATLAAQQVLHNMKTVDLDLS